MNPPLLANCRPFDCHPDQITQKIASFSLATGLSFVTGHSTPVYMNWWPFNIRMRMGVAKPLTGVESTQSVRTSSLSHFCG